VAGPGTGKGKGKVVLSIGSDDEVSFGDDHPLWRRSRLLRSDGSVVGGPPSLGQQVLKMATASSVAAPGRSGIGEPTASAMEAAAKEAVAEKEAADAPAMKKAADDVAATEKAAEEASKKTADASVGADSSPTLATGAKRAVSWRFEAVVGCVTLWFLFFLLVLCLTRVLLSSVSTTSGMPTPRRSVAGRAPGTSGTQDAAKDCGLQDPSVEVAYGDGTSVQEAVPETDPTLAMGAAVSSMMVEAADGGPTGLTASAPSSPPQMAPATAPRVPMMTPSRSLRSSWDTLFLGH
jgi:hypothetical protein